MFFQQQDLLGTHYHWCQDGNHIYSGAATRRIFDRYNGNQVLFLINLFGSLLDDFTIQDGKRVERWLQDSLPMESKSEISVMHWIREFVPVTD